MMSIANMKPESRKPGRNVAIIADLRGQQLRCARRAEMNMPEPQRADQEGERGAHQEAATLPRNGTRKRRTPSSEQSATSTSPMAR